MVLPALNALSNSESDLILGGGSIMGSCLLPPALNVRGLPPPGVAPSRLNQCLDVNEDTLEVRLLWGLVTIDIFTSSHFTDFCQL